MLKVYAESVSLCLLAISLAGCASFQGSPDAVVPMADKQHDFESKNFIPPRDQAKIYVYRNEDFGSAAKISIAINGKTIGQTANKVFFALNVSPGKYRLGCFSESKYNSEQMSKRSPEHSIELLLDRGSIAYVWQEMKIGFGSSGCRLHTVDQAVGQQAIRSCEMAQAEDFP